MTQHLLQANPAGIRLIAQTTLYNAGKFDRLHTFVQDSYLPDLLAAQPAADRLTAFERDYAESGKRRILQVIAHEEHHVIVLMLGQLDGDLYLIDIRVEPDFPHRIIEFSQRNVGSGGVVRFG